jgi:hypothetical protein
MIACTSQHLDGGICSIIKVSKASSPTSEITYPQDNGAIFASGKFLHNLGVKLFDLAPV